MLGRAILWLTLALGVIVAAISLGFALYMLGAAAVDWLVRVALQTAVFRAAWNHPASLMGLVLFTAGGLAAAWAIVPRVARSMRRASRRKAAEQPNAEGAAE